MGFVGLAGLCRNASSCPEFHALVLNKEAAPERVLVVYGEIVNEVGNVLSATLFGMRMSIQRVPVAGPGLAAKPNTGGFTVVGVFVPLSVQMLPRLQKPCRVGDCTGLVASAGVETAAIAAAAIKANL